MAYDYEGNYVDERGMGPNPEFMVQPDRVYSEPTAPPPPMLINPDFAVMPPTGGYDPMEPIRPPMVKEYDPNYNPYENQPQPYNPYETQLQPYPYEAVRDGGVTYPYDPSTNTYPTAPPGYNPYDTQPKPYQPYETLPLPYNPQPYNPYDTPDKSPMDIGQLLARLGYGNSSKPTPTMTPMASGTAVAAPGTGSDLASLLRRYYGK